MNWAWNSFVPIGLADFGARVTGEARPLGYVPESSSAAICLEDELRSSLGGSDGRCREEIEMAEGRRILVKPTPNCVGEFLGFIGINSAEPGGAGSVN